MNKQDPLLLLLLLYISLCSCKDKADQPISQETDNSKISAANPETASGEVFQMQKLYVIAPNGLSLRKENSLESTKLTGMPLGSEVLLLEKTILPI